MNDRIKQIRKHLKLSQTAFGSALGVSRDTIANIEGKRIEVKDVFAMLICREFNVNEDWLRNGNGDMFISVNELSLDEIIKSDDLSELEVQILKNYFSLDKKTRQNALEYCKKLFTS